MDERTFRQYASLIYAHSGINLGESKKELLRARLSKRMHEVGISNYQEYYEYIVRDPKKEELASLLDVISTNVTGFFREKDHFDFLASVLKEWWQAGQRKFRFWSAGCSSGEEPFSLAITILETLGGERFLDAKILATDISKQVLSKARRGIYEKRNLAGLPVQESKYFQPAGEGLVEVQEFVRKMVVFNYLNLQGPEYPFRGPLDAIFCRNVMIYFDEQGRRKIIDRFHRLLKDSGYLLVGHSESLLGLASGFRYVQPSIYQKV
ncbi:MAG: protein-glutamate O-methyltransferase [bacterium]|nr:protein-glutamate O-methyltransferase [bacterium]